MTDSPTKADIIEAMARALYEQSPLPRHDEERGIIVGSKPWGWLGPDYHEHMREKATAAYEAAAPLIAQALAEKVRANLAIPHSGYAARLIKEGI